MLKRWLLILLQTLVTAGLLVFFFHDPTFRQQTMEALRQAAPGWILLGVLIAGVENFLGVIRWRVFLRMLGMELPFWKCVQICLVALFCNTFLPGGAGGDLVRAAWLIRRGFGKTESLLSVVLDRVSGLGALIIYTFALGAWHYDWLMGSPAVAKLFTAIVIYQIGSLLFIIVSLIAAAQCVKGRLPKWAPFPDFVRKMGIGYSRLVADKPGLLKAMGLSLVMLAGYFAVFWCSAKAFGQQIGFFEMSTLVPVADMISALPISLGGLGVREGTFVLMLGQLCAIPKSTAFSISLVGYLMNMSWGLVGAAILPFFKGIVREAREVKPTA